METINPTVISGQIKKERQTGKLIAILSVLTLVGAAFFFSAQPASISKLQSNSILNIFRALGFDNISVHVIRKLAHFVLFATMGVTITSALSFKFRSYKLFFLSYGLTTLMGIVDETHQMFIPGRGPQVTDVLIDSMGALLGITLIFTIMTIIKAIKTKTS